MNEIAQEGEARPLAPDLEATTMVEALAVRRLYELLLARRRTVLLAGLMGLVLSAILAFLLPLRYTASASFVPPGSGNTSNSAALMGQLSSLGGMGLLGGKSQGDLYVGIMKSHTIARELVQRFDLLHVYKAKKESDAEGLLARNSAFDVGVKDPIVTISVTDVSPQRARDLANGYLDALQRTDAHLSLTESSQRRAFYEQRLAKEKDDLTNAEVALKQDQEKTGLIAPAGQTASELQTLAQLHADIIQRQTRLASMLHDESDENPDVLRMRSEISSLQAQVGQMESGRSKTGFGTFSTAQVPGMELEYVRNLREVKYHEALFDIIAKQYEAARLDEAKDAPLQILDTATVPDSKSGPHRTVIMAMGLLMGLLAGIVFVVLRASRRGM